MISANLYFLKWCIVGFTCVTFWLVLGGALRGEEVRRALSVLVLRNTGFLLVK